MNKIRAEKRRSKLPWLVPIIALIATSWLIYKTISESGVDVLVNFKDGSSLKEGKTFVKYRGFNVGKVTEIRVADDVKSINAVIKLNHNVANFLAREGTDYWIVEPKVTVSEISGLDTIVTGAYIEVRPAKESKEELEKLKKSYFFDGYSSMPLQYYSESGVNIVLTSPKEIDVKRGTPIFYKKIQTGKVIGSGLNGDKIEIYANIYKEYENLVNESTVFYNSGGAKLRAGFDGVDIKVDSLASLIGGGISFKTIDSSAKKIEQNHQFALFESLDEVGLGKIRVEFEINEDSDIKVDSKIVYKGNNLGEIKEIKSLPKSKIAVAMIDDSYRDYLKSNTKFYIVTSDIKSMDFSNLDTMIKGTYITLVPSDGKDKSSFKLYNNYKDLQLLDMVVVSLKADRFSNLNIGSDVYYKNVSIGRIVDQGFLEDYKYVDVKIAIEKKYKKLLNDKTLFYIINTPLIEANNFDFSVNFERVKPFVFGGIGIEYLPSSTKKVKDEYWLFDSYLELQSSKKELIKGYRFNIELDSTTLISEDVPIYFNMKKIGYVEKIDKFANTPNAIFFIDNSFKHLIKQESKFYFENGIEFKAGIDGVDFKVSSLENLLKGAIVLTNKVTSVEKNLNKSFNYKLYNSFDNLPFEKYDIELISKDSKNLDIGSKILYKGIEIGRIKNKSLSKGLNSVNIDAYIYDKFKELISSDSIFYFVKPEISLEGVNGLDTVVKGSYIEFFRGKKSDVANIFNLYNNKPLKSFIDNGKVFLISSKESIDLKIGSKIFYKKIEIGVVENLDLNSDASKTIVRIFIYDKYKQLVKENSEFYLSSGIEMDVSLFGGAKIKADSLETILKGGLDLINKTDDAKEADELFEFELKQELKEEKDKSANINSSF